MHIKSVKKCHIWQLAIPVLISLAVLVAFSPTAEASINVEGDLQFRDDVNECLNTYRDAPGIVGDVIEELENSENEHTIRNSPDWTNTPNDVDEATGGSGSGTVTRVDKEKLQEYIEQIEELEHKDFCTALLHELYHAVDADRGLRTPNTEKIGGQKRNEVEATLFQNFVHAIRGVPPRTHYGVDISEYVVIDSTSPLEEDVSGESASGEDGEAQSDRTVSVLVIGGKRYPVIQFSVAEPDACEAEHWHAHRTVYALDGSSTTDPNPRGCGFGITTELQPQDVDVTEDNLRQYPGDL